MGFFNKVIATFLESKFEKGEIVFKESTEEDNLLLNKIEEQENEIKDLKKTINKLSYEIYCPLELLNSLDKRVVNLERKGLSRNG